MSGTANWGLFVALLAAGQGSRFGGGKLDAPVMGKPLGSYALEAALTMDRAACAIVVGEDAPAFALEAAEAGEAELIRNPDAQEGLSTSVALAARHAELAGCDRLLLMLADMPLVTPALLERLIYAAMRGHNSAVRYPDGKPGIPAVFTRESFGPLQKLGGDRGAGLLLREDPDTVMVPTPVGELSDVDTPEEIRAVEGALAEWLR